MIRQATARSFFGKWEQPRKNLVSTLTGNPYPTEILKPPHIIKK